MRKFIVLVGLVANFYADAQQLVPYRNNDLWGFADVSGKVVISPQYERTDFFTTEGFAVVKSGNLFGAIDKSGKVVLPVQYTAIFPFSKGLAAVCKGGEEDWIQGEIVGGKWGFINVKMQEVIPCQFARAQSFVDGYAIVQEKDNWGNWGLVDAEGKTVLPFVYATYSFDMRPFPGLKWGPNKGILQKHAAANGGSWQLIDLKGKPLSKPKAGVYNDFTNKLNQATSNGEEFPMLKGKVKIIRPSGTAIEIDRQHLTIKNVAPRIFIVTASVTDVFPELSDMVDIGETTGLMDNAGNLIVDFGKYDEYSEVSEGIIRVKRSEHYGFIDILGKEIISPRYRYADLFRGGFAYVEYHLKSKRNKALGYINTHGVEFFTDSPEVNVVFHGGQNYLLNESNSLLVPSWMKGHLNLYIINDSLFYFSNDAGETLVGRFKVQPRALSFGEYYGLDDLDLLPYTSIDSSGSLVEEKDLRIPEGGRMEPLDGLFGGVRWWALIQNNKYGIVDITRGVVVNPVYDKIEIVQNSSPQLPVFAVYQEGKIGFLSGSGKEFFSPQFDSYSILGDERTGTFIMLTKQLNEDNQRLGVMDLNGNLVVPVEFISIEPMDGRDNAYSLLRTPNDRVGVVRNYIDMIIPPIYSDSYVQIIKNKVFFVIMDEREQTGVVDANGKMIVPIGQATGEISVDISSEGEGPAYFEIFLKKKYGYASSDRGIFIKPEYSAIEVFEWRGEKFFHVKRGKKYGVLNQLGQVMAEPKYESVESVLVGDAVFVIARYKGKYGLLNEQGNMIVPFEFGWIEANSGSDNMFALDGKDGEYYLSRELKLVKVGDK